MIDIQDLTVQFGSFRAVDQLNLSIKRGELFGFLGPNGAGKTTTIRVLNGVQPLSKGRVLINGWDIKTHFSDIKKITSYIPDTENHYEDFTGYENLLLYAKLYGVSSQQVDYWLDVLQLSESAHVKVRNYSKGMKKKLLIARELLHDPQLIFFDEPTANLDVHSIQLVRQLLKSLTASGKTIFLTTHDMEEVEQICDRVAILAKGTLLDCDTPTGFITRHAERVCDVQYEIDGHMIRESYNLDEPDHRSSISDILHNFRTVRFHSREFCFEDVFKKITGEAYR